MKKLVRLVFCVILIFSFEQHQNVYAQNYDEQILIAAKSKKSKPKENETVKISAPKRTFFSGIDSKILELTESGSPQNLKQAASLLYKNMEEHAKNQTVLLAVVSEMFKILWPSEQITWEYQSAENSNPYIGAIESSKRGVYDTSTGNADFLTLVLPSLVFACYPSKTDFLDEAETNLTQALLMNKNSLLANYLLAHVLSRKKNYSQALDYFSLCKNSAPENFEINLNLSKTYFYLSRYKDSLELTEKLLALNPQNTELLDLCAQSSYRLNNMEKAENYVVKLLLVEPENLDYLLLRAQILVNKGDFIRASSLLDAYAKTNSSAKGYLLLRSKLLRDWNKNLNGANQTISQALDLYPDDVEVLLMASQTCSLNNTQIQNQNALDYAQKILFIDPNNIDAKKICISQMIKNSNYTQAYELSSQLINSKLADDELLYDHIDICISLRKNDEAAIYAQKIYNEHTTNEQAQQVYLKYLVATRQNEKARTMIDSLLQNANPKMKSFLYYEKSFLSSSEDAILSDLRLSLTSNPRNKDALYKLYEIYFAKKDYRRSQYYLKQVVALDPNNQTLLTRNTQLESLINTN